MEYLNSAQIYKKESEMEHLINILKKGKKATF